MIKIPFFKMSACGNDFCIIDNRSGIFPSPPGSFINAICKRRFSLGADGLILLENSDRVAFKMRFYNADGGEAEMCGNGARCIARYAYINDIAEEKMEFETRAGIIKAQVTDQGIRIGMEDVNFPNMHSRPSLSEILPQREVYFIRAGVPHIICFVRDTEGIDVNGLGRRIRWHENFKPDGTNVNFVACIGPKTLKVRTYERGVEGETFACGTGSIAAAIVAASLGYVTPPVQVITWSGCPLLIDFQGEGGTFKGIWLEGEARVVCSGNLWMDEIIQPVHNKHPCHF